MIYIGIDPGLTGAMASYCSEREEILDIHDMPTRPRIYGTGLETNWTLFKDHLLDLCVQDEVKVVVENVGAMPKQGVTSSFVFGQSVGGIRAVIETMGMDYVMIHPATWKRRFGLVGTDKEAVVTMLFNTHPEARHWLTLKKHHNRADAMALAIAGSILCK